MYYITFSTQRRAGLMLIFIVPNVTALPLYPINMCRALDGALERRLLNFGRRTCNEYLIWMDFPEICEGI